MKPYAPYTSVTVDIDAELLSSAGLSERMLVDEVKLELALSLYRRELISAGKAAEVAGLKRGYFENILKSRGLGSEYSEEMLAEDLAFASEG